MGAPVGWNEQHEFCLETDRKCSIHAELQGMTLEKQANKKYLEKPRTRGRYSRGSGSQKAPGNKVHESQRH